MDSLPHISVPVLPGCAMEFLNMSMPSFPKNGADMTREEALTTIIACIAMEELALSHILNAGGEHLQFVLGTLPGASSQDVLAVHKSVTSLLHAVTQNQMLLKHKLDQVLEFCPRPPLPAPSPSPAPPPYRPDPAPCPPPCCPAPCPPPCALQYPVPYPPPRPVLYKALPCETSALQLTGQLERMLWNPDCRLSWRLRSRSGDDTGWDGRDPAQIQLNPGKTYVVQYTLHLCAISPSAGTGSILLKQSPCGAFTDAPPLCLSLEGLTHGPQTLQHVSVLYPRTNSGGAVKLSLVLNAKTPLSVERAAMDIVAL